ncbi:hypothetical protein F5144DRAFT_645161 [Chaetomium tenue]|uniref:Uncharacterized protein n=1 Tax=Chaetomium tenue TaxID=1854479 RepID=A0ACB7PDA9_9PEZI|nr:hypothetical protein F5144DRAFT_645161 [Chaetomium globosum]
MTGSPKVYNTLAVNSGCLCFGELHNIWNGASVPVQSEGIPAHRPQLSGTVQVHRIEYNITARNGIWNGFRLIDLNTKKVAAWFLAHSDVDPEKEVDKILRVSGSPYEDDSGSSFNDDKTAAEGVFVINRYDWGYYDSRSQEVMEPEEINEELFASVGLVDLSVAKPAWLEGGAWLHVPNGEYLFGRFGFDDDHDAARSFLFFTTNTYFTRTAFDGLERTLRKEVTQEERFERKLREGFDFSGLGTLRELSRVPEDSGVSRPPWADCLGPYRQSDHVLRAQEIDAIRVYRDAEELKLFVHGRDLSYLRMEGEIGEFIEPWAESLYDVVNEMVLSYLQRSVIPSMANRGVSAAAELLFPRHTPEGETGLLDVWCHRHFRQPDARPIPNFDSAYVGSRIASFLSRSAGASAVFEDECVAGITRAVAYMLTEVLERANMRSHQDDERTKIMPSDVRMAVAFNSQLRDRFQFSRVYWEGRTGSGSPE